MREKEGKREKANTNKSRSQSKAVVTEPEAG